MAWLRSPVDSEAKSGPDGFLEQTLSSKIIADNLPAIDQLRVLIEVNALISLSIIKRARESMCRWRGWFPKINIMSQMLGG